MKDAEELPDEINAYSRVLESDMEPHHFPGVTLFRTLHTVSS